MNDRDDIVGRFKRIFFPRDKKGSSYWKQWDERFATGLPERFMSFAIRDKWSDYKKETYGIGKKNPRSKR